MNEKDLEKIGRAKLTGTVRLSYHRAYRLYAISTGKTIGEILEDFANNHPELKRYLNDQKRDTV